MPQMNMGGADGGQLGTAASSMLQQNAAGGPGL